MFPNEKFPLGEPIAIPTGSEATDIEEFFRGRYRDEITYGVLKSDYSGDSSACVTLMLPAAFAFFLPVYMRIALHEYEICDALADSVISDLQYMAQGGYQDKLNAILLSYSPMQLKAVAEFLNGMSEIYRKLYSSDDGNVAKEALDLYWGRYASNTTPPEITTTKQHGAHVIRRINKR